MRLSDGAEAVRGDLPRALTTTIDVPIGAGDAQGTGVARLSSVLTVRERVLEQLSGFADTPILIGGDCGADTGAIEHAVARWGRRLAVLWCDAHADLNTPQSSPSGAFHGMVLRALLGEGEPRLLPPPAHQLRPDQVVLVGTRTLDEGEAEYVEQSGLTVLGPDRLGDLQSVLQDLASRGVEAVYIHVDLDVLDPSEIQWIDFPEPFGLALTDLIGVIGTARSHFPLAGAAITEFAPASLEDATADLPTILRIISALTSART